MAYIVDGVETIPEERDLYHGLREAARYAY
jgi:hypothetical protein